MAKPLPPTPETIAISMHLRSLRAVNGTTNALIGDKIGGRGSNYVVVRMRGKESFTIDELATIGAIWDIGFEELVGEAMRLYGDQAYAEALESSHVD